jgi:hypothetical protein
VTKGPKKKPAKKAKTPKPSRTHAREAPAEPAPPKMTRAEKRAANKAAHAAKIAEQQRKAALPPVDYPGLPPDALGDPLPEPDPPAEPAPADPGAEPGPDAASDQEPKPEDEDPKILAPTRERYRPEYARIAGEMVKLGATRADLAKAFDVSEESIRQWRLRHPKFAEALRVADEHVVTNCEIALYELATGTSFEQTKVVSTPDGPVRVRYNEALPPSLPAIAKVLTNRAPERWSKEGGKIELTGPNGTPLIPPGQEQDAERQRLELARKVGFMLGAALSTARKTGAAPDGLEIAGMARDITPGREISQDGIVATTAPKPPAPQPAYSQEQREAFERKKAEAVERIRTKYGKSGGSNVE